MIRTSIIVGMVIMMFSCQKAFAGEQKAQTPKVNHYIMSLAKMGSMKRQSLLLQAKAGKMQIEAQKLQKRAKYLEAQASLSAIKSAQLKNRYIALLKLVRSKMQRQLASHQAPLVANKRR